MSATFVSCLTPAGSAAIATVALVGPNAWQCAQQIFRPYSKSGRPLPELPTAGRYWVGRLLGELADEVVLQVRRREPTPWLEVHCHGGRTLVDWLLSLLVDQGAQLCSWQEFTQAVTPDRLQAQAQLALAFAPTLRTASILLDQHAGALRSALEHLLAKLQAGAQAESLHCFAKLLDHANVGQHLTRAWRVVLAGAPNVGKSSLVNALVGYQRSIVAATPGTTRDAVRTLLALDGWPIEITDTAGMREGTEALEQAGIERTQAVLREADLCVWVVATDTPPVWADESVSAPLLVLNKCDLPCTWALPDTEQLLRVSAKTGAGLPELGEAISRRLVPNPPEPGAAVPFTEELGRSLAAAQTFCAQGQLTESARLVALILSPAEIS